MRSEKYEKVVVVGRGGAIMLAWEVREGSGLRSWGVRTEKRLMKKKKQVRKKKKQLRQRKMQQRIQIQMMMMILKPPHDHQTLMFLLFTFIS